MGNGYYQDVMLFDPVQIMFRTFLKSQRKIGLYRKKKKKNETREDYQQMFLKLFSPS